MQVKNKLHEWDAKVCVYSWTGCGRYQLVMYILPDVADLGTKSSIVVALSRQLLTCMEAKFGFTKKCHLEVSL